VSSPQTFGRVRSRLKILSKQRMDKMWRLEAYVRAPHSIKRVVQMKILTTLDMSAVQMTLRDGCVIPDATLQDCGTQQ
jgi:L-asparaginase II